MCVLCLAFLFMFRVTFVTVLIVPFNRLTRLDILPLARIDIHLPATMLNLRKNSNRL